MNCTHARLLMALVAALLTAYADDTRGPARWRPAFSVGRL